jgi:REP element-mobilizing transposase RayT
MPGMKRAFQKGIIIHCYQRSAGGGLLFYSYSDYLVWFSIVCLAARRHRITLLAVCPMPDHIHLLVDCKPQFRPSDAIKIFKGNTARWLFLAHPELKRQLWGGHMWNPSYFIATVSDRSMEQVERYILEQRTK